jgi:DNA-binding protein Fis
MEMSEKYKMDRVTLTEEAKQMLMRYKWPGNIRQLKSVTEQISIFSKERIITPEILAKFIPQDQDTTQLVTIPHENGDHSFENEREILYKILFELRSNVNDMRREMGNLKKQIEEVQNIKTIPVDPMPGTQLAPITPIQPLSPTLEDAVAEEYVEPEKEPENLNLNVLGKQMLEKALERNNGNRKKAAQELGISDRTLYRRLKQYGLVCLLSLFCLLSLSSCKISYTFNGASIDYSKIKTIQIGEFPVRSSYVWAPMGAIFNNQLKDQFRNSTKLTQVKRNGDLKLEGEITRYEQRNKAVTAEGVSAQVELSITVNVRFTNNKDHKQDFEKSFTSQKSYDSTLSLSSVQEELVTTMVKDLCDQIFNASVAQW